MTVRTGQLRGSQLRLFLDERPRDLDVVIDEDAEGELEVVDDALVEGRELASVISAPQPAYDLAQHWLLDLFGSLRSGEPFDLAVLFFRPLLILALYFEWKHTHFTLDKAPILQSLFV
jgi:hypothetical protein